MKRRTLLTLLARTAADDESCGTVIAADIARGDLYAARRAAVAHSSRPARFHSPLSSNVAEAGNVDASECAAVRPSIRCLNGPKLWHS